MECNYPIIGEVQTSLSLIKIIAAVNGYKTSKINEIVSKHARNKRPKT